MEAKFWKYVVQAIVTVIVALLYIFAAQVSSNLSRGLFLLAAIILNFYISIVRDGKL